MDHKQTIIPKKEHSPLRAEGNGSTPARLLVGNRSSKEMKPGAPDQPKRSFSEHRQADRKKCRLTAIPLALANEIVLREKNTTKMQRSSLYSSN